MQTQVRTPSTASPHQAGRLRHINCRHVFTTRPKDSRRLLCLASRTSSGVQKQARLPRSSEEIIEQAYNACLAAWGDGKKRQKLEVLLPLIGATDLDDWPGGIRQEFKAAEPMMKDLLLRLKKQDELQGPLNAEIWDQGDAVGAWKSKNLGLVLFPTGETLKQARALSEEIRDGLMLMVNPQWQAGQMVSDFGIGPWRKRAEDFVGKFEDTYTLKKLRISGDDVRLLRQYPGQWHVFLTDKSGTDECIAVQDSRPSFDDLKKILRGNSSSNSSKSLVERLQSEFAFNKDSLKG